MHRKQLENEIIKCGKDPIYFIKNYVKIEHPTKGLIPFNLFDYQEELIKNYINYRFNIILKSRQIGISELSSAFSTWLLLFRRNKNIVVMANKKDVARNLVRKTTLAIKNIPSWLFLSKLVVENKFSLEFSSGSRIKALATTKDAGRSEAGSLLIIDEAAMIENLDEIWKGIKHVVSTGGSVIMLSSPNGVGNHFHKTWEGAINKRNDFHPTKLMWWVRPDRVVDENGNYDLIDDPRVIGKKSSSWFIKETKDEDERNTAQELCCSFLSSGANVVAPELINYFRERFVVNHARGFGPNNEIYVWREPEEGKKYLISADVATGDGNDFSACHVFEQETMEQVAEYKGKIKEDAYGQLLCDLGRFYNYAILVIESNKGALTIDHVKKSGYESHFYSAKNSFKDKDMIVNEQLELDYNNHNAGICMTKLNRPVMIKYLEEFLRNKNIIFRSERMMSELDRFIWKNGRPEAASGSNDDLVIAGAIACFVREVFLKPNFMSSETIENMINATTVDRKTNVQIPGATKNPEFVKQNEALFIPKRISEFDTKMIFRNRGFSTKQSLAWVLPNYGKRK